MFHRSSTNIGTVYNLNTQYNATDYIARMNDECNLTRYMAENNSVLYAWLQAHNKADRAIAQLH